MALFFVALLALAASVSGHYTTWTETIWPYYYPTISCPSHPHTLCDFYFDGHENDIPTFYVEDGQVGDHPLIPTPPSALSWMGTLDYFAPGIKDYLSGNLILANSRNGTFLTYPGGTYDSEYALATFDQFYLNAKTDAIAHLYTRTFHPENPAWHQHDRCWWKNKCVYLPFSGAWIHNTPINLNKDDNHTEYEQNRRCVVFKTG